jgi:hypothetical protein
VPPKKEKKKERKEKEIEIAHKSQAGGTHL